MGTTTERLNKLLTERDSLVRHYNTMALNIISNVMFGLSDAVGVSPNKIMYHNLVQTQSGYVLQALLLMGHDESDEMNEMISVDIPPEIMDSSDIDHIREYFQKKQTELAVDYHSNIPPNRTLH